MRNELLERARRLTIAERIDLAGAIWDSIRAEEDRTTDRVVRRHRDAPGRRVERHGD